MTAGPAIIDFCERCKADWEFSIDDMDVLEIKAVLRDIEYLDEDFFDNLGKMFDNYFGITKISLEVYRKIVYSDFSLLFEIYCGAETDTAVRDISINALLKIIGSKPWPMYGNSKEYTADFFETLPKLIEKSATGMQLRERSDV
jgi:hypothetical protein